MTIKTKKSALLLSSLSLLLCFAMLIGTTLAWFTDSVTSEGNIIKAGNLDVAMYYANGTEDPDAAAWTDASTGAIFDYDLWEPGYTEVRHIKIANEGTLALKYQLAIVATGEVSDLADAIDVYFVDPAAQVSNRTELSDNNKVGTLTEVLAGMPASTYGELEADQEATITLALKMKEEAGNEYQNKSIGSSFKVVLSATQLTAETDIFDTEYDAPAELPKIVVDSAAGLQEAINNAEAGATLITLADDITDDVVITQKSDVELIIDGDGNDFDGTLLVDGKSASIDTAGVVIQNVNFTADSIDKDACINLGDKNNNNTRYTRNVVIRNCTFDVPDKVAVKSYTGGDDNVTISSCTVSSAMHSMVQVANVTNLVIENCEVYSKNGINVNQSENVTIRGCKIDTTGYCVRYGAGSGKTGVAESYLIENSQLKSACDDGDAVIILRGTAESSTLILKNTTLTGTTEITNSVNATVIK